MPRLYSIRVGKKDEVISIKKILRSLLLSNKILIAQILCPENMIIGKVLGRRVVWTEINYDDCCLED
jgi:hypothetical protein